MKSIRALLASLAILFLFITAPALTTQSVSPLSTVEQATFVYDTDSVRVVSDNALTESKSSGDSASLFGPGVGLDAAESGQKVYRVFGENNKPLGESWTPVDPNKVKNFRSSAGLPDSNTGRFVVEGTIKDTSGITVRKALPLDGNPGGLREYVIPDAKTKVIIDRVSGVNPEF